MFGVWLWVDDCVIESKCLCVRIGASMQGQITIFSKKLSKLRTDMNLFHSALFYDLLKKQDLSVQTNKGIFCVHA